MEGLRNSAEELTSARKDELLQIIPKSLE